jgi:DNA-binding GntR family transcriptional regulator
MRRTMGALAPVRAKRESLTEIVYDAIREAIVSRRILPGERVTEASLAEQLNVSKTPVREALLKLEYVGLIEPDGRRGGRVAAASPASIRQAYEVRIGLEAQAARLVAERGAPEQIRLIGDTAAKCLAAADSGDLDGFRSLDREFHLSLAAATDNPSLKRLVHDVFDLTWALRRRDVPVADDSRECAKQHVTIAHAIEARNPVLADSAMRAHIAKVQDLVLAAFGS